MGEVLAPVQGKATPIHVKHHLHDHVVYAIAAMHRTYRAEIKKSKNSQLLVRDVESSNIVVTGQYVWIQRWVRAHTWSMAKPKKRMMMRITGEEI